jgi:FkbM family methyltransferase
MSWAFRLLPALSSVYSLARRGRLLERSWFRRLYVRSYFLYKRRLEDPFAGLVAARPDLFRHGNILDVGAHIGYTTSLFLPALTPGFSLYAFEPDPDNHAVLVETVGRLPAHEAAVPVPAAVGERDGVADLWRNPRHSGDHRLATPTFVRGIGPAPETTRVPLWSLDGFLADRGDDRPAAFVKIDVQGYEPAVLRGMDALLARSPRLAIAVEYSPRELRSLGFTAADLLDPLRGGGFSLHVLRQDGRFDPARAGPIEVETTGRGYLDLLCLKGV